MKLPGISAIEKDVVTSGEIYLTNLTVTYDTNDKQCLISLHRNGYELKRFKLSVEEYKALKSHSYDIFLMYERFDGYRECEEGSWGL